MNDQTGTIIPIFVCLSQKVEEVMFVVTHGLDSREELSLLYVSDLIGNFYSVIQFGSLK